MKFLVITLGLLSAQLMASSRVLTESTQALISSGKIFELGLPSYRAAMRHIKFPVFFNNKVLQMLDEVNQSRTLEKQARDLVLTQHGPSRLTEFDDMLKFSRSTKTLHSLRRFESKLRGTRRYIRFDDMFKFSRSTKTLRSSLRRFESKLRETRRYIRSELLEIN